MNLAKITVAEAYLLGDDDTRPICGKEPSFGIFLSPTIFSFQNEVRIMEGDIKKILNIKAMLYLRADTYFMLVFKQRLIQ